jgi:Transport and Golgi organisation 2
MCSLIILRRPGAPWPLLLAANRDELRTRPWRAPARHWPDRPEVVAGLDALSGGSWLGVNDYGLVAAVLNRVGSLGPAPGKRSRGELVLEALEHADARAASAALSDLDPDAYRPFNLIVADARDAYWLRNPEGLPSFGFRTASGAWQSVAPSRMAGALGAPPAPPVECQPVPDGLSMITAHDLNDPAALRIRHYLPRFEAAPVPTPEQDDWSGWIDLLADREGPDGDPRNAMTIVTDGDYGTLCSSLLALPAVGRPIMRFAAGRPGETPFAPVALAPNVRRS